MLMLVPSDFRVVPATGMVVWGCDVKAAGEGTAELMSMCVSRKAGAGGFEGEEKGFEIARVVRRLCAARDGCKLWLR